MEVADPGMHCSASRPAYSLQTHISPSARLCQSLLPTYALDCHLSLGLEVEHFHLKKRERWEQYTKRPSLLLGPTGRPKNAIYRLFL